MKTVLFYACAIFFCSCQKEIPAPVVLQEPLPATEVVIPEPTPKTEPVPEPIPEPIPLPEQEIFQLYQLGNFFQADKHYRLISCFSKEGDLWPSVPIWVKDDVHTFNQSGDGLIQSGDESCPADPFTSKAQKWKAYATNDGIKLDWIGTDYKPITYTIISIKKGNAFTVYTITNDIKIFSEFELIGN